MAPSTDHGLEYYKHRCESLLTSVFTGLEKLGEELLHAKKDLSSEDYDTLEEYLLTKLTKSDIKAAKAIARGDLRKELFPAATRSSKVISLSPEDQDRLLSDEEFDVFGNDGSVRTKTWGRMSPDERNRLLGPKGGHLHELDEQTKPGGVPPIAKVVVYTEAHVVGERLELRASGTRKETREGRLDLVYLKDLTEVEWDTLVAQRP